MRNRALVFASTIWIAAASFAGCRDLSFQEPGDDNAPPVVSFSSPRPGDTLPLWWRVAVSAEDPDGLGAATLSCNGAALFQWVRAPYEADLDLSRCLPADATEVTDVTLDVVVADGLGVVSAPASVTIRVDPTLPRIASQVPARVAPGSQVSFVIAAESPLGAPPAVTVDGEPASVSGDAALQNFTVSFTAPRIPPSTASGVEAFYVTGHDASVEIVAAAPNGNEVRLTRTLVVSRVLWERPVPGHLTNDSGNIVDSDNLPRGNAAGLWLPLGPEGTSNARWTPGFFRAAEGTFVTPLLPSGALPRGFTHDGRVLVDDASGTQTFAISPESISETSTLLPSGPLLRFSDKTCAVDWIGPGQCITGGTMNFTCLPAGATPPPSVTFNSNVGGAPTRLVQSGDTFLAFSFLDPTFFCQDDFSVMTIGAATNVGTWGVTGPSGAFVTRALPLGKSGAFFAQEEANAVRIENGLQSANYPSLGKTPPGELLAGRDDGSVIVATAADGHTTYSIATTSGETPASLVPGSFPLAQSPLGWATQTNVIPLEDGGLVYLAHPSAYARAVVALDAALEIQWIYPYPRATDQALLVGDAPDSQLYLVDFENDYVVALARP